MHHATAGLRKSNNNKLTLEDSVDLASQAFTVFKFASVLILLASVITGSFWAYNSLYDASAASTYIGTLTNAPSPAISVSLPDTELDAGLVEPGNFTSVNNTVTISTDYPTGYTLSISADSASLAHSASDNYNIGATAGNFSSPSVLSSGSWGFAINGNSASSDNNTVINSFSSSYASPASDLQWAQLPTDNTTIKATNKIAESDATTVYYGVNTNDTLAAGEYSGTVTLSTIANESSIPAPTIISISDNYDVVAGGKTVTITGTNFSVNGSSVTSAVKIGDNDCTDVKIYKDSDTNTETLTCVVPASTNSATGSVNVVVTNWTASATLTNGFTYAAPLTGTINTTSNEKSTSQTATITCAGTDITAYYWGTTSDPAAGDYTSVTATTDYSTTESVTDAGTYYLSCKNSSGNVSAVTSQVYNSITVYNMLETTTGTEGTYNTTNYPQASTDTYIIPNGTIITMSSNYTIPTGASVSTYKGYTTVNSGTPSTATTLNISSNTTLYFWFNRATYTLTLNKGTGISSVSGTGTYRYGQSVSISATVTSNSYAFSGWTTTSGNRPSNAASTSTTVTITQATSLTANAPQALGIKSLGITYMQDSTIATKCSSAAETNNSSITTYELTDRRNSQKYYIRKFAFNNKVYCMMVENLYLVGGTKLTSTYSNVSSAYTLPSSSTSGYTSSNTTAQMYNGSRFRSSGSGNSDGSYYNWCAATAGTGGCYDTNKAAGTYDICPKYWRLPTSTERGYIKTQIDSIGINTFFAGTDGSTHVPVYAGLYSNSSLSTAGSVVYWWSSAQFDATSANSLRTYSDALTSVSSSKRYGFSVRCLVAAS